MKCAIDKIWETGMIPQKEKAPARERKRRKYGQLNGDGDSITISEDASESWTSYMDVEGDAAPQVDG